MKKIFITFFFLTVFFINIIFSFELKEGDILFQDLDCGEYCEAIEKVTNGYNNYNLSHVAIAINYNNDIKILETSLHGVVITELKYFLKRSFDKNGNSKTIVGRILPKYKNLINPAINYGLTLLNKPYDKEFNINNDKYYCSELIYIMFKHANGNNDFFQLDKMTFINPDTNKTFEIWKEYFEILNIPIPEGKPGINPGGISRSKKIKIIYKYGILSKKY